VLATVSKSFLQELQTRRQHKIAKPYKYFI